MRSVLLGVLLLLLIRSPDTCHALSTKWTPEDSDDKPLPLSASWRSKLSQLKTAVDQISEGPARDAFLKKAADDFGIEGGAGEIRRMFERLEEDSNAVTNGGPGIFTMAKKVIGGVLGAFLKVLAGIQFVVFSIIRRLTFGNNNRGNNRGNTRRQLLLFLLPFVGIAGSLMFARSTGRCVAIAESSPYHFTILEPNAMYMSKFLNSVHSGLSLIDEKDNDRDNDNDNDNEGFQEASVRFKESPTLRSIQSVCDSLRFGEYLTGTYKFFAPSSLSSRYKSQGPSIAFVSSPLRFYHKILLLRQSLKEVDNEDSDFRYSCAFSPTSPTAMKSIGRLAISITPTTVTTKCRSSTLSRSISNSLRKSIEGEECRRRGGEVSATLWKGKRGEREKVKAERRARESAEVQLLEGMSDERKRKWRRGGRDGGGGHYTPSGERMRPPSGGERYR